MAFSGSQSGFPSARLFAKRMLGCEHVEQSGQNEMGKREAELDGANLAHPVALLVPASLQPFFHRSLLLFPGSESLQKSSLHSPHAVQK